MNQGKGMHMEIVTCERCNNGEAATHLVVSELYKWNVCAACALIADGVRSKARVGAIDVIPLIQAAASGIASPALSVRSMVAICVLVEAAIGLAYFLA